MCTKVRSHDTICVMRRFNSVDTPHPSTLWISLYPLCSGCFGVVSTIDSIVHSISPNTHMGGISGLRTHHSAVVCPDSMASCVFFSSAVGRTANGEQRIIVNHRRKDITVARSILKTCKHPEVCVPRFMTPTLQIILAMAPQAGISHLHQYRERLLEERESFPAHLKNPVGLTICKCRMIQRRVEKSCWIFGRVINQRRN